MSCTHTGEKKTVFRILMKTAEIKSRLEDRLKKDDIIKADFKV